MAKDIAPKMGVDAVFTSGAISDEEHGNPVYPPAARTLAKHGHAFSPHQAHQVAADEVAAADLVIAMTRRHLNWLRNLTPEHHNLRLLCDFHPTESGDVPDPWYGPESGYEDTYTMIDAAMPAIMDWCTTRH